MENPMSRCTCVGNGGSGPTPPTGSGTGPGPNPPTGSGSGMENPMSRCTCVGNGGSGPTPPTGSGSGPNPPTGTGSGSGKCFTAVDEDVNEKGISSLQSTPPCSAGEVCTALVKCPQTTGAVTSSWTPCGLDYNQPGTCCAQTPVK